MLCDFSELNFQPVVVDRFFHQPGDFRVDGRPYAALSYREMGEGAFEVGGQRFVSRPGDILFLPAGMDYRVRYSGGHSVVLHLSGCGYTVCENSTFAAPAVLYRTFCALLTEWQGARRVIRIKELVYRLLREMAEMRAGSEADREAEACAAALRAEYMRSDLSLADLCGREALSASQLRRRFHRLYGCSPMQYLMKLRMERAAGLLFAGGCSVREVAAACGFADEKYFSRAVRRYFGMPPSALHYRPDATPVSRAGNDEREEETCRKTDQTGPFCSGFQK